MHCTALSAIVVKVLKCCSICYSADSCRVEVLLCIAELKCWSVGGVIQCHLCQPTLELASLLNTSYEHTISIISTIIIIFTITIIFTVTIIFTIISIVFTIRFLESD